MKSTRRGSFSVRRSEKTPGSKYSSTSGLSPRGERPLVQLYLEPGVFSERRTEKLPLRVDFIHRVEFGEVGYFVTAAAA